MKSLIMAGGKGSRLRMDIEKPLIKVGGIPMLLRVLKAVKSSGTAEFPIVVTSPFTPNTKRLCESLGIPYIEGTGKGYVNDLKYTIQKLKIYEPVLTLPSDLPLLMPETISLIVMKYHDAKRPAMSVYVPVRLFNKFASKLEYVKEVQGVLAVPSGINVVDGSLIDLPNIPEAELIVESIDLMINVNTREDLMIAEKFIKEGADPFKRH